MNFSVVIVILVSNIPHITTMFEHIRTQQIRLIGILIFMIGIVQPIFSQVSTQEKWKNEPFGSRQMEKELIQKRDKNSKHFINADGTITAHLASGDLHYWEDNQWKTIFHTIEPTALGFQNVDNSFKSFFPANIGGSFKSEFSSGEALFEMKNMKMYFRSKKHVSNVKQIEASIVGSSDFNQLVYPNVYGQGIDVRFTQLSVKRKMDYIIQRVSDLGAIPTNSEFLIFEESIQLPDGWSATLIHNQIVLKNRLGETKAVYEKPVFSETRREHNHEHEDTYSEIEGSYELVNTTNLITIKILVPLSWLTDPTRSFPVTIDPSINFTPDNTTWWTGNLDGYHNSTTYTADSPLYNSAAWDASYDDYIEVGRRSTYYPSFGWMKFNVSSLPNDCVLTADLNYRVEVNNSNASDCAVTCRLRHLSGDPVSTVGGTLLNDIRDGAIYADNVDFRCYTTGGGWVVKSMTANLNDIATAVPSGWFGVGIHTFTGGAHTTCYTGIYGYSGSNKPYLTVNYKSNYQAVFSNVAPIVLCAGQTQDLTVNVANAGCLPWTSGGTPPNSVNFCWWGSWQAGGLAGGQDNNPRVYPFSNLLATQNQNVTFSVTAPATPGTYSIQLDLVRDGVCWFRGNGAPSCGPGNVDYIIPITVVSNAPTVTGATALCLGTPSQLSADGYLPPTGGTITTVGNDRIHSFTANGTFVAPQAISNASILVVGGGGGGGSNGGGGGGGGGVTALTGQTIGAATYTVTRGAGGAGVAAGASGTGGTGGTSSIAGLAGATATGGLGGVSNGGAGGNSSAGLLGGVGNPGTGVYNPSNGTCWRAGGGGAGNAALGTGANHTYAVTTFSSSGGNGGNGTNNNFRTGSPVMYGKGGAGATAELAGNTSSSTCGNMAGSAVLTYGTTNNGAGGVAVAGTGVNGSNNRGGGGGGAINGLKGGNGGTGLVVIRYTSLYTWTSSNPAVATVDPFSGLVTPVSVGSSVISCTPIGGGCATNVPITVSATSLAASSVAGGGSACHGQHVTLTPSGATVGTNAAHVWYKGGCNNAFTETWSSMNYGVGSTTVNSLTNGILNVSSTSADPMIHMNNIGSFDPTIYRYINIRYRVTSGAAGGVEIFFHNASHNFAVGGETGYGTLISDGNWHVLSVDMHTDPDYLTGGNILGWRYDWATANSVTMDLDFIQLSQFPMIDEDNTTPQLQLNYGSTHYPAAGQTQTFATSIIDNCGATSCVSTTVSSPSTSGNLGNNNDDATCVVNQNGWVHFYHSSGRLLASINSEGTDLGNVTVTSYDDGAPVSVFACDEPTDPIYRMHTMERHWLINPTNTGSAKVRLPFYSSEYSSLAAAANGNENPNDQVTGLNTVRLSKYSGGVSNTNEDANAPNNCPGAGGTGNTIVVLQDLYGTSDVSAFPQAVGASSYVEYSISGFSEFWLHGASSSPLPVELVSFSGNCMSSGVQLDWSTASESNNAYFEVQRSRDLQLWETIAHVNGAGNSSQLLGYQYIDQEALEAAYYRIVQVDYNGDQYIKSTVHVTCSGSGSTVSVYPNPTQADFTVKVNAEKMSENARIILFDVTGKRIIDRPIAISKGVNEFYFDTVLETGSYLVKVFTDFQEFEVVKFVVKH